MIYPNAWTLEGDGIQIRYNSVGQKLRYLNKNLKPTYEKHFSGEQIRTAKWGPYDAEIAVTVAIELAADT